ncbi:MAG: nitronate monooxygenase [Prevotellaceae bacterium]|jgi:NAD(P)H-dependent flavin oxidoreductase YrpB (nitropropane dioxygenase family)|nr:nitronate monooxygenase [Prevotellaceae bacterium]
MDPLVIGGLTVTIPIIQGGMGVGVSLSGLASAVANEGGIGVISSAGMGLLYQVESSNYAEASIIGLKKEIAKARKNTSGVIGVNVMVAMTNFSDMVRTAIEEKVDIIFSGAGLPLDLPSYLTEGSVTKLIPIVSSARAAKLICNKWKASYSYLPDAIVVEGPKAGGHLGFKEEQIFDENYSLEVLVKEVRDSMDLIEKEHNVKIPIIAAGGIYTGEDINHILSNGADGVQMGTRFVTSIECDASDEFKQTYINAEEKDIEIIKSPVGMPGRAILNSFMEKVKQGLKQPKSCPFHCIKTCNIDNSPYCIIIALFNAFKGNMNFGYAFAGSNAYKATKIQTIKEIFADIKREFNESCKKFFG